MLINFSQVLKDSEGDNLQLDKDSPALTLKEISKLSIKAVLQDDAALDYKAKIEWARLSESISKSGEEPINIATDQVARLKDRICKVFPAIMVAYAVEVAIENGLPQ